MSRVIVALCLGALILAGCRSPTRPDDADLSILKVPGYSYGQHPRRRLRRPALHQPLTRRRQRGSRLRRGLDRLWTVERKHLPDVDVARAGGWRDLAALKRSYQRADAATMLKVVENTPGGHIADTPATQAALAQ